MIYGARPALHGRLRGGADLRGARDGRGLDRRLLRRPGGRVLMRLADVQLAFPFILLAIAVIGVLGPSLPTIIAVIGVSSWVVYARVVRGAVLTLPEREFVQAALALGGGDRPRGAAPHPAERVHALAGGGHPRHGPGDRHRVGALVPRTRRAAPHADVGRDAGRRPGLHLHGVVAGHVSRGWPSSSPSWESTSSATVSATRSTPALAFDIGGPRTGPPSPPARHAPGSPGRAASAHLPGIFARESDSRRSRAAWRRVHHRRAASAIAARGTVTHR